LNIDCLKFFWRPRQKNACSMYFERGRLPDGKAGSKQGDGKRARLEQV
jgi:hypothetical protein